MVSLFYLVYTRDPLFFPLGTMVDLSVGDLSSYAHGLRVRIDAVTGIWDLLG